MKRARRRKETILKRANTLPSKGKKAFMEKPRWLKKRLTKDPQRGDGSGGGDWGMVSYQKKKNNEEGKGSY